MTTSLRLHHSHKLRTKHAVKMTQNFLNLHFCARQCLIAFPVGEPRLEHQGLDMASTPPKKAVQLTIKGHKQINFQLSFLQHFRCCSEAASFTIVQPRSFIVFPVTTWFTLSHHQHTIRTTSYIHPLLFTLSLRSINYVQRIYASTTNAQGFASAGLIYVRWQTEFG